MPMNPAAPATEEEESSPLLADEEEERNTEEEEAESDYDDEVDVPLKVSADERRAFLAGGNMDQIVRRCAILDGLKRVPAPRFAAAGSTGCTAGVLRAYVEEGPAAGEPPQRQIMLLYRFTRFVSGSGGGGDGLAVLGFRSTKLRFVVPGAGDATAALRWAGPALGPLIYPASHAGPLHELWAKLVCNVRVRVPPRAARVCLRADVGILRRSHFTPRRMGMVCHNLGRMTEQTWPVSMYHVAMELRLPEPVPRRHCEDRGEGKGKEELDECPVCLEPLESDLAKWPGCLQPHVFHGECLELALKESDKCPLCRRRLSAPVDG